MNVRKMLVTPQMAQKWLDGTDPATQRPVAFRTVDLYANDMKKGHWLLTHQGICIDEGGNVQDGNHRLLALVKADVSLEMFVTTDAPIRQGSFYTFDGIDRGRLRGIGQQLQVRHGIKNGNLVAAACNSIAKTMGLSNTKISTAATLEIYKIFQKSIGLVTSYIQPTKEFRSQTIVGSLAICHHVCGQKIEPFILSVGNGEKLARKDPAYTLRQYLFNNRGIHPSMFMYPIFTAAMYFMKDEPLEKLYHNPNGLAWFRDRSPALERRLKEILGSSPD